jgi:hypothetical protein
MSDKRVRFNEVSSEFGSYVAETTVYPRCQRGITEAGFAHDFESFVDETGRAPLMFCRQCGLVQKLEVLP